MAVAGPSFADITPQQAWDNLEAYMQGFGYEITATEDAAGDTLTVSGITMTMAIPEEDGTATFTMPDLTYTAKGDGSVDVTLPGTGQMVVAFTAEDAESIEVAFDVVQSGMLLNVSGTETDMLYTYEAETLGFKLAGLTVEGESIPPEVMRGEITAGPVSGSSKVTVADGVQTIAQEMTYGDMSYDVFFKNPETEDEMAMAKGMVKGVAAAGTSVIPENADFSDPANIFASGMEMDATMTHQGGQTEFNFQDGSDVVTGKLSSTGGELSFAMSPQAMTYAVSALGQTVSMMVPDMPFPIDAQFGEAGFALEMPLAKSEEPVPASFSILLAEFTMADMLWNIFDPGQVLPRDPATIGANIEAEVTPFVSLMNPEEMAKVETGETMPGELNSVTLSDLVVKAIGAQILGEGAFTFDNTDLESFDGLPRPEGEVKLEISGINGVIDKLIQMGFVQEQDAMGARMMLGMFTVPGSEPDTASSTIVVNEQGHVLANGQRIK